jgi:2-polyprenyl-3-methyl-5-hydroxy-6-metoxy-1,4-benzoquinol methylase
VILRAVRKALATRAAQRILPSAPGSTEPTLAGAVSQVCTMGQMRSAEHRRWCALLKVSEERIHRKIWEYSYVLQVVEEQLGALEGRRALGFGVGKDRLAAAFAALGCRVVATDQDVKTATEQGWAASQEHAPDLQALNDRGICDPALFAERVELRVADMNRISNDLRDFDFAWSACALEHLGSIEHGLDFIVNSLDCVRPGGIVVHTTEFNLSSNDATVDHRPTVLFRRCDLERLEQRLRERGAEMLPLNLHPGTDPIDEYVDVPPYKDAPHLRLLIRRFAATSVGIAARRAG